MEHSESGGDAAPRMPDGPPPARERLPLPRRRRQAHLEPQLRTPRSSGTGTPFSPFAAFTPAPEHPAAPPAPTPMPAPMPAPAAQPAPPEQADRPERRERPERPERQDRAAAFHAGTRRGRGAAHARRRTPRRGEPGQPYFRPPGPEGGR